MMDSEGKIVMVPIRRGEMNGRAFTSIADGYIIPADNIQSTFNLSIAEPKPEPKPADNKPLNFSNKAA